MIAYQEVLFKDKDGIIKTELVTNDPEVLEVKQRLWYYPFGMQMDGIVDEATDPNHAYRYNGKELEGVSKTYEYGFRYYDPTIGRFTGVDPIADQFAWVSVFNYAENRPVDGIDLWGLQYLNFNKVKDIGNSLITHYNNTAGLGFPVVEYNGQKYYNLGFHMNGSDGNRVTEWVYTRVSNFDPSTHHIYTWMDPTLTGNNNFGSPRNQNCADLAYAQAIELGTNLAGGAVNYLNIIEVYNAETNELINSEGAIDYINSQLELGNAVVVGVDDGDVGGTDSRGTDHYVTIVGRDSQNGQGYFFFIDNAMGNPKRATNFNTNRITPGTGNSNLGGQTVWGNRNYETTRVQENQ